MYLFFNNLLTVLCLIGYFNFANWISTFLFKKKKLEFTISSIIFVTILTCYIIYISLIFNIYFNFFLKLILAVSLFFSLLFFYNINKKKLLSFFNFIKGDKILIIYLLSFFLISLLPATDADSLDYHLSVPKAWINDKTFFAYDNWLHYRLASYGEVINLFGVFFEKYNLLSLFKTIFFIFLTKFFFETFNAYKNYNIALKLLVSTPILIYFIFTQKPQFFGFEIIIFSLIVLISKKNNFNLKDSFFFVLAASFVGALKLSFIPIVLLMFILLEVYTKKKFFKFNLAFIFIINIILWFPLLYKNFILYDNPISPFFENYLSNSPKDYLINFSNMLKTYGSELSLKNILLFPIKLVFPFEFSQLTTIYGMGFFCILFLRINKSKNYEFLVLLSIITLSFIIIMAFGQLSNRYYYISYFLLICLILHSQEVNKFMIFIITLQYWSISLFLFLYAIINLPAIINDGYADNFLKKNANQYYETLWLNENLKNEKYASDLRSKLYLKDNHYSLEYLHYVSNKNLLQDIKSFVQKNNIEYISLKQTNLDIYKLMINCKKNVTIKKFKLLRRNFLNEDQTYYREIFIPDFTNKKCI